MNAIQSLIPDFKKNEKYDDYWKLMTDSEISKVSRSRYVSIGSHAYLHNNLGNIRLEDAVAELQKAKKYLEEITQLPCTELGYPDGSYTRELIDAAEEMGFKYQMATENYCFLEDADDSRIENRFGIYPVCSSANMIKEIVLNLDQVYE
jgi:peptidoglycan/xylan/chitin deacetylase (PgdA/CDA1 family)